MFLNILWVNNSYKWITVIFFNLCDNLLYYMICFCLLSLVFAFICLLSLSCLHISNTHPVPLPTLWIYSALPTKTFPNFTIFFVTCPYYWPTTSQQIVKHYIYNIRERESHKHRVTKPKSQKAKKKQKTKAVKHIFNLQSPTSVHHSSIKTQTPQVHKHRLLDFEIHKHYTRFWRKW